MYGAAAPQTDWVLLAFAMHCFECNAGAKQTSQGEPGRAVTTRRYQRCFGRALGARYSMLNVYSARAPNASALEGAARELRRRGVHPHPRLSEINGNEVRLLRRRIWTVLRGEEKSAVPVLSF